MRVSRRMRMKMDDADEENMVEEGEENESGKMKMG